MASFPFKGGGGVVFVVAGDGGVVNPAIDGLVENGVNLAQVFLDEHCGGGGGGKIDWV